MAIRHTVLTALSVALLVTSGCTRIRENKGYVADEQLISAVQPGVDNRQSVERMLGRPTLTGQNADDTWYYVSRKTEQLAFLWPEASEHDVLVVHFTPTGAVESIERLNKGSLVDVNPASETTPTRGREYGFWEQLVGNLGRFSGGPGAGSQ